VLRGALFVEYLIATRMIISKDATHGRTRSRSLPKEDTESFSRIAALLQHLTAASR
jgi:hypothetical protein